MANEPDKPMTEQGEDIWSIFKRSERKNRGLIASTLIPDTVDDAIATLPEEDKQELKKRLRKLLVASFNSHETDAIARREVGLAVSAILAAFLEEKHEGLVSFVRKVAEERFEEDVARMTRELLDKALAKVKAEFLRALEGKGG
jgi:hypothetical protein